MEKATVQNFRILLKVFVQLGNGQDRCMKFQTLPQVFVQPTMAKAIEAFKDILSNVLNVQEDGPLSKALEGQDMKISGNWSL